MSAKEGRCQVNTKLLGLLKKHEGLRLKPYHCSAGKLTIGIGRNLEAVGISEAEANLMLANDITRIEKEAVDNLPYFNSLSVTRQDVVLSMIFNLGLAGFLKFKNLNTALTYGNFKLAAQEMIKSSWYRQVGARADELAFMMEYDIYRS